MKNKRTKTKDVTVHLRADLPSKALQLEQRHFAVADVCRENPGMWALIYEQAAPTAYATVSNFRHGRRRPHAYDDNFDFAATTDDHPHGRAGVYVRYTPPTDD